MFLEELVKQSRKTLYIYIYYEYGKWIISFSDSILLLDPIVRNPISSK